jgi:hypothetical protein
VAADLPSLAVAAPGAFVPYVPSDAESLAKAISLLYVDESLRQQVRDKMFVRTWSQRAAEMEEFLDVAP